MISIILPTYNEKGNILHLISKLQNIPDREIIVVDDNSPDGTASAVEKLPGVVLVKRPKKLGLSTAIRDGALKAKGDVILVMDADLSHPPEKAAEIIDAMNDHDLIVGSRSIPGSKINDWPRYRELISNGAHLLAVLLLGVDIYDPLSGFFAIKKDLFLRTRIRTKGYKILLNILYDNPKMKIKEIPYSFQNRYRGETKLGSREIIEYLFDLLRIRFG